MYHNQISTVRHEEMKKHFWKMKSNYYRKGLLYKMFTLKEIES